MCIIELGGTVGDIESMPFIEAMRQLRRRAGKNNFLQIHVSLVPVISGEQKTKPTQQAIRDVRSAGLSPDLVRDVGIDCEIHSLTRSPRLRADARRSLRRPRLTRLHTSVRSNWSKSLLCTMSAPPTTSPCFSNHKVSSRRYVRF